MSNIGYLFLAFWAAIMPPPQRLSLQVMQQAIVGSNACTVTATPLTGGIYDSGSTFTGFSTTGSTFATVSAIAPDCTKNAALITEDTSTGTHLIALHVTSTFTAHPTTLTQYFKISVGTRNIQPTIFNSTFSSQANVGVNISTCATVTAPFGSGAFSGLVGATLSPISPGWCKVALTVSSITDTSVWIEEEMENGTSTSYTGDGISGNLIWAVDLR